MPSILKGMHGHIGTLSESDGIEQLTYAPLTLFVHQLCWTHQQTYQLTLTSLCFHLEYISPN
jgi:hypothetical protein